MIAYANLSTSLFSSALTSFIPIFLPTLSFLEGLASVSLMFLHGQSFDFDLLVYSQKGFSSSRCSTSRLAFFSLLLITDSLVINT